MHNCGLCVKLAEMAAEPLGLAFIGRGFEVWPRMMCHTQSRLDRLHFFFLSGSF